MELHTPITEAGRLFQMRAGLLENLDIKTIKDLIFHIPHRYDDFTIISKIAQVQAGETVTIQGEVLEIKNEYLRGGRKLQKGKIQDETGSIAVSWFNQPFIPKVLSVGQHVSLSGRVGEFAHKPTLESPEYEVLLENTPPLHTGRLVPIYPETKGLSSKWLRRQIYNLLSASEEKLSEYLPDDILITHQLLQLKDALWQVHFPISYEQVAKARERLAFEELFFLQLAATHRRTLWKTQTKGNALNVKTFEKDIQNLKDSLPFTLTGAQEKALLDIFSDMSSPQPMNRLLEGDVGSGKTVVSAIAMYLTHLNGYQSVLMAPTEILAQQHYATIQNLLAPFKLNIHLITGSIKSQVTNPSPLGEAGKSQTKTKILNTKYQIPDILIGTHAVLSKNVTFKNLGLVVIDEQQRFGVEQRSILRSKGIQPHLLTMTATPIPRTVALTLYGDLDLSFLDEMPIGRMKIKTWVVPEEKRDAGYTWIKKQIKETDSQIFVICPFIEASETMTTIKAASKEYERLKKDVFQGFKLGLLHGRMKGKEKDAVLSDFKNKKYDILVATPVVEVGIDVANATIIVIEAAERFGLAQLHQLRGRVGRGNKQSYCLLYTDNPSATTLQRLKAMETMHNGASLAEIDYKLRGPGELYGTSQHGRLKLKIASFGDTDLMVKTKKEAEKIYPDLVNYPTLLSYITSIEEKQISPD